MSEANHGGLNWDAPEIAQLIRAALDEDLGAAGDRTVQGIVEPRSRARARIEAKQPLVLAGLPLAAGVFGALDQKLHFEAKVRDGASVPPGATVASLHGYARSILSGERTALNFLAHLSGIATLTRRFVEEVAGTRAQIRDTRKTTPLLRMLEKYAVRVGGGSNHRFGLFDAILIKENHIALAGGVSAALDRARARPISFASGAPEMVASETFSPPSAVEIEVRNEAELREALGAGADAVLLDNVSPAEAARLVTLVRQERPSCVVEVSGGVTLSTVRAYAEAGVDFISVGALTHSAPAADLSLLVEPPEHE
ncbi:MAG TPA: carboxylating nicotinate-nucleotide diphosphorylase [Candidatus Acidoferrales bacterium]|nr:carboxylating nicotinate-nucleotide diphosphorylase [Candidatus Acidoferrales bacterium]